MTPGPVAACADADPAHWDDEGTPHAHNLCRTCPAADACLEDAREGVTLSSGKTARTNGVMRAGVVFNIWGRETKRKPPKPPKPPPETPPEKRAPGRREVTGSDLTAAINIASVHYKVRPADVTTATHRPRIAAARSLAYAVLRQAGYSSPAIGLAFDRHHTTVLSGTRHAARDDGIVAAAYHGFLLLRSLPRDAS